MCHLRAKLIIGFILFKVTLTSASSVRYCSVSLNNCNGPGSEEDRGGRISSLSKYSHKDLEKIKGLLNLKNYSNYSQLVSSSIEINQSDITTNAVPGNSWVKFDGTNELMVMNIGSANSSVAQSWSLPSDFMEYFEYYSQYDFLSISSVPSGLNISGATHVTRSLGMDEYDNDIDIYDFYNIGSTTVSHLGSAFDMETDTDDTFDEPDFEFMTVPFKLGDIINAVDQKKDPITNLNLVKVETTLTVDAYGTIVIPGQGTFNCLRGSYLKKTYTRPDESSPFVLKSTKNNIGFFTKQGHFFYANVVSLSGSNATLEDVVFQTIIPTALLSGDGQVILDNNQRGVSINTNEAEPDSSAILDISSNNKGILIPRITSANRPSNPATGLLVYQVDNTPGFYFYDGTEWQMLNATTSIASISSQNARIKSANRESGNGRLQRGSIFVKFDKPRDDFEDLFINIELKEDCNGVFISNQTREGFEVKELKKGKSNAKFSWSVK